MKTSTMNGLAADLTSTILASQRGLKQGGDVKEQTQTTAQNQTK